MQICTFRLIVVLVVKYTLVHKADVWTLVDWVPITSTHTLQRYI